jgi:hypothetical protein
MKITHSRPSLRLRTAALALALLALSASGAWAQLRARATVYSDQYGFETQNQLCSAILELTNDTPSEIDASVIFYTEKDAEYRLEVERIRPRETRVLHAPLLAGLRYATVYGSNGSETNAPTSAQRSETKTLHISTSRTKPTATEEQKIYEAFFWDRADWVSNPQHHRSASWSGYSRAPISLSGTSVIATFDVDASRAPTDWRCFMGHELVFLSEDVWREIEGQASGEALLNWVQTGGLALIYLAREEGSQRMGAGLMVRTKVDIRKSPNEALGKLPSKPRPQGWRDFSSNTWNEYHHNKGWNPGASEFPTQIASETSYNSPIILSLLFFIVAGPANYLWLRSRKRVKLLFVTVPAISLAFCALITLVFFLSAGLDRRGAAISLTWVDQRGGGRALTAARQMFYSGVYPGGGFRWEGETFFLPVQMNEGGIYNMTKGLHLRRGQFEPLSEMHYLTLRPFQTREKIEVRPSKRGDLELLNGFETDLDSIIVRHNGRWLRAESVRSGDAAPLGPLSQAPLGERNPQAWAQEVWPALDPNLNSKARELIARLTNDFAFQAGPLAASPSRGTGTLSERLSSTASIDATEQESLRVLRSIADSLTENLGASDGDEPTEASREAALKASAALKARVDEGKPLPEEFRDWLDQFDNGAIKVVILADLENLPAPGAELADEGSANEGSANFYFALFADRPPTAEAGPSGMEEVGSRFFLAGAY